MSWLVIIVGVILGYILFGLMLGLLNNFLSKREFMKVFDPTLDTYDQKEQWRKSFHIMGGMDVPFTAYVFFWPLVGVACIAEAWQNRDEYKGMGKVIQKWEKDNPEKML